MCTSPRRAMPPSARYGESVAWLRAARPGAQSGQRLAPRSRAPSDGAACPGCTGATSYWLVRTERPVRAGGGSRPRAARPCSSCCRGLAAGATLRSSTTSSTTVCTGASSARVATSAWMRDTPGTRLSPDQLDAVPAAAPRRPPCQRAAPATRCCAPFRRQSGNSRPATPPCSCWRCPPLWRRIIDPRVRRHPRPRSERVRWRRDAPLPTRTREASRSEMVPARPAPPHIR